MKCLRRRHGKWKPSLSKPQVPKKVKFHMPMLSQPLRSTAIASALLASVVLVGCQSNPPVGDTVRRNEVQNMQSTEFGVVTQVRPVNIQPNSTALGTTTGAVVGGAAGSNLGSSSFSNTVGAVGGAVAGGMAGNAVQSNAGARQGVEVTVRLDSGRTVTVIQEGSPDAFRPGDRVRVTSDGQNTRVSR
jgi:outer membrane lipoprotein SlyB